MEDANLNIILLGVGLGSTILIIAMMILFKALSKGKKETRNKLDRYKERFSERAQLKGEQTRAVRMMQRQTGLAGTITDLLPRKDLIQKRLAKAGIKIDLSRYAILSAALGLLGIVGIIATGGSPLLGLFAGIIMGVGLPHMIVSRRMKKRMATFTKQFPEAMELIVRGLKSGLPVNECIANVAQELPAPTGIEFQNITDSMRIGKQLEEALWETADRLDTPDFKFFVISLVVQRETGGNLGETLGNLATILRQRQAMKLKIKALSSEAKASAWIMGLLPFIMLSLIMTMNYDYGIVLFTHPTAILAGIGALIWMGIGILIMSKMISFEV